MWKSGRNINSRRAALAEGYMEDTRESRGRKFSGSTAMILGLFITLVLFAFMVLYSGVVAVLTDK